MEKQRHCVYCCEEINEGYICQKCKAQRNKESMRTAQHKAYNKRKAEIAKLREDNEEMRKIIEELKNAN